MSFMSAGNVTLFAAIGVVWFMFVIGGTCECQHQGAVHVCTYCAWKRLAKVHW